MCGGRPPRVLATDPQNSRYASDDDADRDSGAARQLGAASERVRDVDGYAPGAHAIEGRGRGMLGEEARVAKLVGVVSRRSRNPGRPRRNGPRRNCDDCVVDPAVGISSDALAGSRTARCAGSVSR
jgi:hypothetical protein